MSVSNYMKCVEWLAAKRRIQTPRNQDITVKHSLFSKVEELNHVPVAPAMHELQTGEKECPASALQQLYNVGNGQLIMLLTCSVSGVHPQHFSCSVQCQPEAACAQTTKHDSLFCQGSHSCHGQAGKGPAHAQGLISLHSQQLTISNEQPLN